MLTIASVYLYWPKEYRKNQIRLRLHVAATLFCPEFIYYYIICILSLLLLRGKPTTWFELSSSWCAATGQMHADFVSSSWNDIEWNRSIVIAKTTTWKTGRVGRTLCNGTPSLFTLTTPHAPLGQLLAACRAFRPALEPRLRISICRTLPRAADGKCYRQSVSVRSKRQRNTLESGYRFVQKTGELEMANVDLFEIHFWEIDGNRNIDHIFYMYQRFSTFPRIQY